MEYISELQLYIERKVGRRITSRKDANLLRAEILKVTHEPISESTIRRFFHLIPRTQTSKTTMDILSNYVGFSNYNEFVNYCNQKISRILNATNSTQSILSELENVNFLGIAELNLIGNYLSKQIIFEQYDDIISFFENENLFQKIIQNQNAHDLFSQIIGSAILKVEPFTNLKKLLASKNFAQLVLHRYIDIGNIEMEKIYNLYLSNTQNPIDTNIFNSVLALNAAYTSDFKKLQHHLNKINIKLKIDSPEFNGRLALLKWILDPDDKKIINQGKLFNKNIHLYSIDIVQYCLLMNKISFLTSWLNSFPNLKDDQRWISSDLNSIYEIAFELVNQKKKSLSEVNFDKTPIPNSKISTIYQRILSKISV